MLKLTAESNAVLLPVKVVPGASRTGYIGEWDGRAKIAVAAPPEKGKANKALVAYLARRFRVRRNDIVVVTGTTTPTKLVRIAGVTVDQVRQALT